MQTSNARLLSAVMLFALGGAACGTTKVDLSPTERNPASTGHVVAKERGGNTQLTLDIAHLPRPSMLDPSLTTFVAWVRPVHGARFTNIGQIEIDDDRAGRLQTITPYRQLVVLVTGEASATAPSPSRYVLLQGEVDRR